MNIGYSLAGGINTHNCPFESTPTGYNLSVVPIVPNEVSELRFTLTVFVDLTPVTKVWVKPVLGINLVAASLVVTDQPPVLFIL